MGARQSKRSVDITTTPKKGDGEASPVNEDKIEKLGDADVVEVVTNGTAGHTDIEFADKDETKESEEKPAAEVKENGVAESDGEKTPDKEAAAPAAGDPAAKSTTEVTEEKTTAENGSSEKAAAETPDAKKQKEKKKKKWSLRSISFSKKDKSKPSKDKDKNGEVEEVNEEKEEEVKATTETTTTEETKTTVEEPKPVEKTEETIAETPVVEEAPVKVEAPTPKDEPEEAKVPEVVPTEKPDIQVTNGKPEEVEEVKEKPVLSEETCSKLEKGDATEETAKVPSVEEVKEVRNEEVPPPLPNSNPPSQVAVFAESLKDDTLLIQPNTTSPEPILVPCQIVEESDVAKVEDAPVATEHSKEEPEPVKTVEVESSKTLGEIPTEPVEVPELNTSIPPKEEGSCSLPSVEKNETSLEVNIEISSAGDSSPLVVEALSKPNEETVQIEDTAVTENNSCANLAEKESETSNVETDLKDVPNLEVSANIENTESLDSLPTPIEEKIPIVSSAGDVLSEVNSDASLDNPTEEFKSNLNLTVSTISQDSNLCSEEPSVDLSVIPEAVESNESKTVEEKPVIESNETSDSQQDVKSISPKDIVEPLCNADSLADLSTESLPSLPEPTDSVLEPMSLPPLDSVPEPLPDDNLPSESLTITKPIETDVEVVLTNGKATNGIGSSPSADEEDTPLPPSLDGPLKQKIASEIPVEEISQSKEEKADAVETVQTEAQ